MSDEIVLTIVRIIAAILRKQNSVMTVSDFLNGEFGLRDVCLSVPSIFTDTGVTRVINVFLSDQEMKLLRRSAGIIKEAIDSL